jgi:hypothetical protein
MSDVPTIAPAPPDLRRRLNITLAVGLADALLLVVLVYFAFINRSDTVVHILGPIHGLGFIALLLLTGNGALQKLWGWWFPALVIVTGGPIGSIIGDLILRRGLNLQEPDEST